MEQKNKSKSDLSKMSEYMDYVTASLLTLALAQLFPTNNEVANIIHKGLDLVALGISVGGMMAVIRNIRHSGRIVDKDK